jgi:hypothetical protein
MIGVDMKKVMLLVCLLIVSSISQAQNADRVAGIGVEIDKAGVIFYIKGVLPNTPAGESQVEPGDLIVKVKQAPDAEWTSAIGLSIRQVVKLIRGPVDSVVALRLFRPSTESLFEVSLQRKEFEVKNESELDAVVKASIGGNPEAQNLLGEHYLFGKNVPQDFKKAMYWFLKSSKKGHATAPNHIGRLYLNGEGVKKDERLACRWYRLSAKRGDSAGKQNAEWCRSNGEHHIDRSVGR